VAVEQQSFEQIYPGPGWVEHDAEVIWATVMSTSRAGKVHVMKWLALAAGIHDNAAANSAFEKSGGVVNDLRQAGFLG
jgi:glycerol kinase